MLESNISDWISWAHVLLFLKKSDWRKYLISCESICFSSFCNFANDWFLLLHFSSLCLSNISSTIIDVDLTMLDIDFLMTLIIDLKIEFQIVTFFLSFYVIHLRNINNKHESFKFQIINFLCQFLFINDHVIRCWISIIYFKHFFIWCARHDLKDLRKILKYVASLFQFAMTCNFLLDWWLSDNCLI